MGEPFCLGPGEGGQGGLCPLPPYLLCGVGVSLCAPGPAEACLRPRTGCAWWSRQLPCCRRAWFACLPPGEYVLALRGGGGCLELLLRLPPGANVEVRADPGSRRWRWRRDPFHYFFNQL